MQCHAIVVLDTTSTTTTHASNPADTLEEREMKYLTQKNMKKAWKRKRKRKNKASEYEVYHTDKEAQPKEQIATTI